MEIPDVLINQMLDYFLNQIEAGDTEAEELLDELIELHDETLQVEEELKLSL